MRLEVVEAPDHSACMEQLRSRYGADCVVVHSFRVKDRYRVVVALETESCRNAAPLESAVKTLFQAHAFVGIPSWMERPPPLMSK